MRKLIVLAVIALAAIMAAPAQADSPHFIRASATVSDTTGQLVCGFKLAGLGTEATTATVNCTADASATYQCFNRGGNHPQAGNKTTVDAMVGDGGTFPVRNGSVTGLITVDPPSQGSFSCPSGQRLFLTAVSYTNILLTGEGATADVPGTLTATGLHILVA